MQDKVRVLRRPSAMHIFLSYSSADRDLANRVHLSLVALGHHVFFDRENLTPGWEYDSRIAEEIRRADLFIFLISPESIGAGRYTLTEVGLAQQRWKHPARCVLPVMIRATPIEQVPQYLKAVTILYPTGDIPAELANHVRRIRPPWPKWFSWVVGGIASAAVGVSIWALAGMSPNVQEASNLLQNARSLQAGREYASAYDKILEARTHIAQSPLSNLLRRQLAQDVAMQQVDIVTAWLDDMHIDENERFSDLASKLLPTLDEAIANSTGERKATLLAYRGWADFLRSRDGGQHFKPETFYQKALQIDPVNVYAHTMWGHWITWTHGPLEEAKEHFQAALEAGRERPYVRRLQFTAMANFAEDIASRETLRTAYEMVNGEESVPEEGMQQIRYIYSSACGRSSNRVDTLFPGLSEKEHIALIRHLFKGSPSPRYSTDWVQPCIARLQEHAGMTADALETYRTLQKEYSPQDPIWHEVQDTIQGLLRESSRPH
jgi:hypothetical protein